MDAVDSPDKALRAGPRRRYLTVLFADLCGSTALSARIEAELYAEMLGRVRGIGREVIARHGGLIVRAQGDGLLAIFGQPEPREDDGRRATEAALELHAAIRLLDIGDPALPRGALALHSGIHAGLVLLIDGDLELGRYEVLGPVPNVAARLSDEARFDQILVSEETLGPQAQFFATGLRLVLDLAGVQQPLPAYQVLARAPVGNRFTTLALRGLAPFVGREAEMQTLRTALRAAASGVPQFVLVSAGPGMGKTRLVEEFLRSAAAAGHGVHRGYCESYLSAEPLQPFLQMLRELFRLSQDIGPSEAARLVEYALATLDAALLPHRDELLRVLSLAAPGAEARRPDPERIVAALGELFDSLAARRTLVLFIDDWQWVDDASRQALAAVRARGGPMLVLLASREGAADALAEGDAATIELAPLSDAEVRQTIEHLLPGTDPFSSAQIHLHGGGNPLFIEELCHSVAADGTSARPGAGQGQMAWLGSLVESRVTRLPEDQATLVRAAAILGNVFPAWLLERVTGCDADGALVHELARQDFIFPAGQTGALRFKHGITREVIYDAVGLRERQGMHRRVAEILAEHGLEAGQEDAYEALAYHWGAGGRPAEAARFAELAGDKAMSASALDRARTQYRAALAALDAEGALSREAKARWISVVERLGMACVFDPLGLDNGLALFERGVLLADEIEDDLMLARAEYWLGYIAYAKGDSRKAVAHAGHALELAAAIGESRLAAQVRATLGQALAAASDYERALPMLDLAVDQKRRNAKRGSSLAIGSAYTLATKGLVLGDRGEFDAAHECLAEALAMVQGTGHQIESSVLGWNTTVLLWQGRWDDAITSAEQSSAIAGRCKSRHLYAMHRAQVGYAQWVLTEQPDALQAMKDATAWVEAGGGRLVSSLNHGWLSDALATLGRTSEARRHAARALRRARAQDRIGEAMACRALAHTAAQAGDRPRAAHYLVLARRSAEARGSAHEQAVTALCEARIEAGFGRVDHAMQTLEAACPAFERMKMAWHLWQAHRLAGRLLAAGP